MPYEHYIKQRAAANISFFNHGFHYFLKRRFLVLVSLERCRFNFLQMLQESFVAGHLSTKSQSVYKKSDEAFHLLLLPAGNCTSDTDIAVATISIQHYFKCR